MSEHYYTSNPTSRHEEKEFAFELRGYSFHFVTDAGVFSKDRVDFGSAFLIERMEIGERDEVLDVGCGYGPIGLCAARLASKGNVLMADINERAVALANENARRNRIDNASAIVSDLFDAIEPDRKFDAILSNPPIRAGKSAVHQIFEGAYPFLKPGGSLWIVIQKKQGAPSALKKLQELFDEATKVAQKKGYWVIRARKKAVE